MREKITYILLVVILFLLVVGCKAVVPVASTTAEHNRDSMRIEYKHDSIYIDRWHHIFTIGDTVYIHDSIWRDRWHTINKRDSIYINNTDTIYQTNTIEVEKKGSAFLRNSGIALWVILSILLLSVIVGIVLRFVKR